MTKWIAVFVSVTSFGLTVQQRHADQSHAVNVDCNAGGAISRALNSLKPATSS